MKKTVFHTLFPYIVVALAALVLVGPLLTPGFITTDDGNWMIIRFSAFYQSLREGQFPVRFLGRLNYEYGYPVANFLYPGFMYAGSFIRAAGIPFVDTVKMLMIFSVVAAAGMTYAWLRRFFHRLPSVVGTVGFIFSPYLAFDIYKRGSVGELFAFPWVAVSLYAIESGKRSLFALAIGLLIISHNSVALMALPLILLYLMATKRLREYGCALLLGLGLSAFFWMPALHERKYVVFDQRQVSVPSEYFVAGRWFWLIGLSGLLALILSWSFKVKHARKSIFGLVYILAVFLTLPVSRFLWDMPLFASLFQFPFRFLAIGLFLGAWFIALVLNRETKKRWVLIAVFSVGFLMQFLLGRSLVKYEMHPEEYYTTNEATTTVQDEYMPRWVSAKPAERPRKPVEFYQGNGIIRPKKITLQTIDVEVEAQGDSIVQINTMYYPGWGVTVDGARVLVDYENPSGVMRIAVPAGVHRVTTGFRETVSRFLADLVSACSLVLFALYTVYQHKKTRRGKR